ncbi:MAG: hypothetical protein H6Q70_2836 [Firmicutes bacterium]|nr:hypothetical protein [Bacillota bacterium]
MSGQLYLNILLKSLIMIIITINNFFIYCVLVTVCIDFHDNESREIAFYFR